MDEPGRLYLVEYLRLSKEDETQGESESISSQRAIVEDYRRSKPELGGYEVLELADDGYSGANFHRPGVKRLLELVRQRRVGCVIVKDLSRFGRSYKEVGGYLEQVFPFLGVRFISVTDRYDSAEYDGAAGLSLALKTLVHDLYSRDISQKVKSSRRVRALHGDYLCTVAPYGYVKSVGDNHRLEIDEPAAQVVRRIFSLLRIGTGTAEIARLLNREEVPTPLAYLRQRHPGRRLSPAQENVWTSDTVLHIVKNECYTGQTVSRKQASLAVGGKKRRRVPRQEQVVVPGCHEAIIPEQEFREAQGCYPHLARRGAGEAPDRLFRGQVRCGGCHLVMKRSGKVRKRFYCRTNRATGSPDCVAGAVGEDDLADTVLASLRKQAGCMVDEAVILRRERESRAFRAASQAAEAQALQRRLNTLNLSRLALFEKFGDGRMTREEYLTKKEQTNQRTGELSALLEEAESRAAELEAGPPVSPCGDIPELTGEIVDLLVRSIKVYAPDRVEIIWRRRDEFNRGLEWVTGS